jgi:mRNA interferase RelE/StbE
MTYTIEFKKSVKKDIRLIPMSVLQRIKTAIYDLQDNPLPIDSKKLRDQEHTYRIRVGQYRIVYEIEKDLCIITVIRIAHRKDVYRGL